MTSKTSLVRCRSRAVLFLNKHKSHIDMIAKNYRYRRITYKHNVAVSRARGVQMKRMHHRILGLASSTEAFVSQNRTMSMQDLIGTIVHEALHYSFTYKRKSICTRTEHILMKMIAEELALPI